MEFSRSSASSAAYVFLRLLSIKTSHEPCQISHLSMPAHRRRRRPLHRRAEAHAPKKEPLVSPAIVVRPLKKPEQVPALTAPCGISSSSHSVSAGEDQSIRTNRL